MELKNIKIAVTGASKSTNPLTLKEITTWI